MFHFFFSEMAIFFFSFLFFLHEWIYSPSKCDHYAKAILKICELIYICFFSLKTRTAKYKVLKLLYRNHIDSDL